METSSLGTMETSSLGTVETSPLGTMGTSPLKTIEDRHLRCMAKKVKLRPAPRKTGGTRFHLDLGWAPDEMREGTLRGLDTSPGECDVLFAPLAFVGKRRGFGGEVLRGVLPDAFPSPRLAVPNQIEAVPPLPE